jgi:hypothetical protein
MDNVVAVLSTLGLIVLIGLASAVAWLVYQFLHPLYMLEIGNRMRAVAASSRAWWCYVSLCAVWAIAGLMILVCGAYLGQHLSREGVSGGFLIAAVAVTCGAIFACLGVMGCVMLLGARARADQALDRDDNR